MIAFFLSHAPVFLLLIQYACYYMPSFIKISLLKRYLLVASGLTVAGLVLFYYIIQQGLAGAQNLTRDETTVLNMLDNLDKLNGAFILIENNEKRILHRVGKTTATEINRAYNLVDSTLLAIDSFANGRFFSRSAIAEFITLSEQKMARSKQLIAPGNGGNQTAPKILLQNEIDDTLGNAYMRKYNALFATGRLYVLDFQKAHIDSSARAFATARIYCLLVFFGLLFVVWQSLKNLNRQERLINENKTYRDIIENSQSLVTVTDEHFKLKYCNSATERLLGKTNNELIGKSPELFFMPAIEGVSLAACVANAKAEGGWAGEFTATDASGNIVNLHSNISVLYNQRNELLGCFAVHSNVTALKLAQQKAESLSAELQQLNNELTSRVQEQTKFITEVFSRVNEDFVGADKQFAITYVNAAQVFSDRDIVLGQTNLLTILADITTAENVGIVKNAFDTQQPYSFEFIPTGNKSWFKLSIYPTATGLSLYFMNITNEKTAATELEKLKNLYNFSSVLNEMILRSVSEIAIFAGICKLAAGLEHIAFCVVTLYDEQNDRLIPIQWSGNGSDYLKSIAAIKPLSPETGKGPVGHVVRTGDYYYCNDIDNDPAYAPWRDSAAKRGFKSSIALPIKKRGKLYGLLSMYASVLHFFSDEGLAVVLRVIDNINYAMQNFAMAEDSKKAQEQLQLVSSAIDQRHSPVIVTDLQRNIIYANLAFCERAAMPVQKIVGRNIREVRALLPGGKAAPTDLDDILFKEHRWKGEFYSKDASGLETWELVAISAIHDSDGTVTHFSAISEDITERKKLEMEEKNLTINLMQSNRSLKQFSYALSHYIRAPLSNILAFKEILQEDMPEEELRFVFDSMIKSAEHIDLVIKDITPILHQQEASADHLEKIDFEQIMRRVSDNLAYMIEEKQAVIKADFDRAGFIVTVRSYIKSIFLNILLNAMQYAKAGSHPLVEIWTEKQGTNTLIHFKDYGQGIDLSKHKNELFGLYKRFNFSVPGKGLGLYSVKAQAEYLGGTIEVYSVLHEWTEFVVSLPDQAL